MDKKNNKRCFPPPIAVVPQAFSDAMTYGQRQYYMWQIICQLDERVTELEEEVNRLTGNNQ